MRRERTDKTPTDDEPVPNPVILAVTFVTWMYQNATDWIIFPTIVRRVSQQSSPTKAQDSPRIGF